MPDPTTMQRAPSGVTNLLKLVLAWAWVGIPGLWGVSQVAIKSLALFK